MEKLFVIEDQTVLRDLLCRLIEGLPMIELLGSSGDGREGHQECAKLKPTMVIVDVMLPGLNGMEVIHQLRKENPQLKTLLFTAHINRPRVQQAMKTGVNGLVHKNASIEELEKAIEKVAAGQSYMSGEVLEFMRSLMMNPGTNDDDNGLTAREREILQLIAEGKTTKEIGNILGISTKTADSHRTNIMSKLDIHDVAGLTRFAIQNDIITIG